MNGEILVLGLVAVGIGFALWYQARKPTSLKFEILDESGKVLIPSSPVALFEGSTYTLKLTVKNNTTLAGLPAPATFFVLRRLYAGGATLGTGSEIPFTAGESKVITESITIPKNMGWAYAYSTNPTGCYAYALVQTPLGFVPKTDLAEKKIATEYWTPIPTYAATLEFLTV